MSLGEAVRASNFAKIGLRMPVSEKPAGGVSVEIKVAPKPDEVDAAEEAKAPPAVVKAGPPEPDQHLYSILVDTSVDITNQEQLLIYVKTLVDHQPVTQFLAIVPVPDGKADTITNEILGACRHFGLDTTRIVCFCSDGASSMTGHVSGVATQLCKQLNSALIKVHCAAHRAALGAKDASDAVEYLKNNFKSTLQQLFYFVDGSAVRASHLKDVMAFLNENVHLIRNGDTRWLSYEQTVGSLYKAYPSVLTWLIEESCKSGPGQAMSTGLVTVMGTSCFIQMLLLWCDIMPNLGQLSRSLQGANVDFVAVETSVDVCIKRIMELHDNPGLHEQDLDAFVKKLTEAVHSRGQQLADAEANGDKIHGNTKSQLLNFGIVPEGKRRQSSLKPFSVCRALYMDDLKESLQQRFPDMPVLSALARLFDPRHYPTPTGDKHADSMGMARHGVESAKLLQEYYSKDRSDVAGPLLTDLVGDFGVFKRSWPQLLSQASRYLHEEKEIGMRHIVRAFLSDDTKTTMLPSMATAAKIACSIAMSSAEVERGFSVMKHVKSADRSRLTAHMLDALLTINISGPDWRTFDAVPAVLHWYGQSKRRLHFKREDLLLKQAEAAQALEQLGWQIQACEGATLGY